MLKEGQIRVSNRMFCSSYGSCLVVCYGIESGESRKTNKCIFTHFKAFCYVKQLSVMDKKRDVRVCFRLMWLLPQLSFTTAAPSIWSCELGEALSAVLPVLVIITVLL